jgi:transposase
MARFRRTTSKKNTYLQLVESYRNDKKQPATRVLANLGNISAMPEEQIERLTKSFLKAMGIENKFQMNNFTTGKSYHYGTCLPVIGLWNELNFDSIINDALSPKITIPVSEITLIQIANRFSAPDSKLACYRWFEYSVFSQVQNFVNFPEKEQEKLHTYYRSLDYLCDIKHHIEKELFYHFNSYNKENSLVFYDLTSVYVEGEQAAMAVPGYSRDHRPGADQIVIGVVMNGDGIPIAHHVFDGNTTDKTTVAKVLADLEQRFSIKNVIFVGDRGLLTRTNIETVKRHGYNYILGMQKRNRRIIKYLLNKVQFDEEEKNSADVITKEVTYTELSKSFQDEYDESVRFVVCFDKKTAKRQRKRREKNLYKFQTLLNKIQHEGQLKQVKTSYHQLKSFLCKYHISKFYTIEIEQTTSKNSDKNNQNNKLYQLSVQKNDTNISFDESLDGKFFLQTEVNQTLLDKQAVVDAYKSLQKVERAFDFTKNEIDIRPVYVRRESRIKGHVMICFLSLLIETLLEKKMFELFPEMIDTQNKEKVVKKSQRDDSDGLTMITLREELDTIRLVPLYINNREKPNYISTKISNNIKKLFSALGIINSSNPENLRFQAKKQGRNKNQLILDIG